LKGYVEVLVVLALVVVATIVARAPFAGRDPYKFSRGPSEFDSFMAQAVAEAHTTGYGATVVVTPLDAQDSKLRLYWYRPFSSAVSAQGTAEQNKNVETVISAGGQTTFSIVLDSQGRVSLAAGYGPNDVVPTATAGEPCTSTIPVSFEAFGGTITYQLNCGSGRLQLPASRLGLPS
jgi:hypothetical protein